MKFSFGVQTHPWLSKRMDDYAAVAAELGFRWLEVTFEYFTSPSFLKVGGAERLKRAAESYGIRLTGHMPYLLSSVNFNPDVNRTMRSLFLKTIDFSKRAGIDVLTLHPPYGTGIDSDLVSEWMLKTEKREFAAIAKHAEKAGMKIAIENLSSSMEEMEWYVEKYGFDFTFDMGHWYLSGRKEHYSEFFKKFKKKLRNIHIHDNNGKDDEHLPLGSGKIGWKAFFRRLEELKYAGPLIIESKTMEDAAKSVLYLDSIGIWRR